MLVTACGAKQSPATTTSAQVAKPLPALPDEPLLLLPASVRVLGRADLDQLRASPHFATARRWLLPQLCLDAKTAPWLIERTTRLVVGTVVLDAAQTEPQLIAIARGDYAPDDAHVAAMQILASAGATAPSEQQQGRAHLWQAKELSVAQLGDHLLVAGHTQAVLAVLAVADGTRPSWLTGTMPMGDLDVQAWLAGHTLAIVAQLDEQSAHRVGRQLATIGADGLSTGLGNASAAAALVLTRDADAQAQVLYADAATAEQTAGQIRSMIGQASFVLRLMGWPSVLDRVDASTEGALLKLALRVSDDEVRQLVERLEPMLTDHAPTCSAGQLFGG